MNDERKDNEVVHSYGDIQEYDNKLPNWWLYTLYGTVIFAIGYWFSFHVFETGELPMRAYRREMAEIAAKQGKALPVTAEALVDLSKSGAAVTEGLAAYTQNCVPCHGPQGGGGIGPNLTDEFWIHGGGPSQIYESIRDGFAAKGMPAWGQQLGDKRVQSIAAYVLSIRNSNVPGGKAPQGDKFALSGNVR